MKWIGLTGGIASGKTTVAGFLRELGYPVVDADQLAREVLRKGHKGYQLVLSHFGKTVLDPQGEIDRKRLGQIVFADPRELQALESIVHPLVQDRAQMERLQLEAQGCDLGFYDVPLLFEKNLEGRFDSNILVYCSEEQQRQRLGQRDGLSDSDITARLRAQLPMAEKLARAQHLIRNEGSLDQLKNEVRRVVESLAGDL